MACSCRRCVRNSLSRQLRHFGDLKKLIDLAVLNLTRQHEERLQRLEHVPLGRRHHRRGVASEHRVNLLRRDSAVAIADGVDPIPHITETWDLADHVEGDAGHLVGCHIARPSPLKS